MPLLGEKGPRSLFSSVLQGMSCGGYSAPSCLQQRAAGHCRYQFHWGGDPLCSCRSQPETRSSQSTEGWPSWEERGRNQTGTQASNLIAYPPSSSEKTSAPALPTVQACVSQPASADVASARNPALGCEGRSSRPYKTS